MYNQVPNAAVNPTPIPYSWVEVEDIDASTTPKLRCDDNGREVGTREETDDNDWHMHSEDVINASAFKFKFITANKMRSTGKRLIPSLVIWRWTVCAIAVVGFILLQNMNCLQ